MNTQRLGFGLMRLPLTDPEDRTSIDIEQVKKMVDIYMEHGFNYFDTAWMYHKHAGECVVKNAIKDRYPRESYTVTTKLHYNYIKCQEDVERIFNEQLEKTGMDYFDYYLLHEIAANNIEIYEKYDCINWVRNLKKEGKIKHYGFSFHDKAEVLDRFLTKYPDFEYVQLQLNYLDWESLTIQSRECYEVARKHGKPIIVMEPVRGGALAKVPAAAEKLFKDYNPDASVASWALRYIASLPGIVMILSGMSNIDQMIDNTQFMKDVKPLNEEELEIIKKATDIIADSMSLQCTACEYCMDGCPQKIAIPKYFALFNEAKAENSKENPAELQARYDELTKTYGKASDCIRCGKCEEICPQYMSTIDSLKLVADYFEG